MTKVDINRIEAMRRSMRMGVGGFARVFGVSRATYYNWIKGISHPRGKQIESVNKTLQVLNYIIVYDMWPNITASSKMRTAALEKLIQENS